jgi:hypothetical protein
MNMICLSSSVHIALITCYRKCFLLHYIQIHYQYSLCKADYSYLTYLMLQRQLGNLNGRKLDHRQVSASYIMSGFAVSYTANMFIFMILYACFEHLPNTSGRTEERTLSVTPKRKSRWSLLGNSGKHVTAIC